MTLLVIAIKSRFCVKTNSLGVKLHSFDKFYSLSYLEGVQKLC